MNNRIVFLSVNIGLHFVAVGLITLMSVKLTAMTLTSIIPAILIACASVPAAPGKPISAYIGFGLLIGLCFWMTWSAVNQREWLAIFPALLLVSGAVWLLQMPGWPSFIFSGVTVLLCLGLAIVMYFQGPDFDDPVPDRARQSAMTTFGILFLGAAYTGLGFIEGLLREPQPGARKRGKKRRQPRYIDER